MNSKQLFNFIQERHRVYQRRFEQGLSKPWTKDPVLQTVKFCNVYRELDTVTQWIANNWRKPNEHDKDMWFAMVVARFINWPETLADLKYPVPWRPSNFLNVLKKRKEAGQKRFTGVYVISPSGALPDTEKSTHLVETLFNPLWRDRKRIAPGEALEDWFEALNAYKGMGSFMTGQVIADVKYAKPFLKAPDWWTFAVSGPGSRRGLNRVFGNSVDNPWKEWGWKEHMFDLSYSISASVEKAGMPKLHMQDLQNCLCEFDKFERVRLGEGRPRTKYQGV